MLLGPGRLYALVFGSAYVVVALLEVVFGRVAPGGLVLIQRALLQNIVHWITGLVVLGSYFAGEMTSRRVARGIAIVFALLSITGLVARAWLGEILGFDGALPWFYNFVHIATAAAAGLTGFAVWNEYTLPDAK